MSLDSATGTIALDQRIALVSAAAAATTAGLSPGRSGNVSVRDGDLLAISPTNADLAALDPDALSIVALDGRHLDGPRPSKEVFLHIALYERDTEMRSIVHVHSPHAVAASCREPWADHCALPPVTPYFLMKVGQVPLIPFYAPGDVRQADEVRRSPWRFRGALLANHGQITAGQNPDAALHAAIEVEEAARTWLLQPDDRYRLLTEDQIVELTQRYGMPWRERVSEAPSA
ncbi:class II aldolase/adducin family protein [Microbacterium sp. TNHR37B]|uniref:class II aldolase/adducin family protein n=1 Tax=Microbacterium sp. TNHR37B TaxID=1775956 RepID=UPI0007B1A82F|nr:class II aldolase/adducin family protein [Microbacterium sp. TNHR37B]KZE89874.1 L-fuculose phosphate aldolase [Microbacterium sp. TNHR37B]